MFWLRSGFAISAFRRWLLWKSVLEPQDVAGGLSLVGAGIMGADAVDQAQCLEPGEMVVQRRDRHFRILGQPGLCRKAAEIRIVAVTKMPEHDLGRGLQPALLDGPVGGVMAHGATRHAGTMRVVKP